MADSSKILTVSYGTFSCTLEGFEDSFTTMKAIAEYFRDLAAEDRYFGAEPPTPDAEMLTRIAEREIARRVEARMSEGGIVLRAADAIGGPVRAPEGRAPVERPAAVPPEPAPAPAAPTSAAPAPSAPPEPAARASAGSEAHPAPGDALAAGAETLAAPDPAEHAPETAPHAATVAEPVARTAPPAPDSVADKLQRIRAVVGRAAALPADGGYDDAAEDFAAADADAPAEDDPEPLVLETSAGIPVEDADQAEADVAAAETADADEDWPEALGEDWAEDDAAPVSAEAAADDEPAADAVADFDEDAEDAEEAAPISGDATGETGIEVAQDDAGETEPEAEPAAVAARVVRMVRPASAGESDDADADDGFEGLVALDGADDLDYELDQPDTALDPDADADLLARLASVERDAAGDAPAANPATDDADATSRSAVAALMGRPDAAAAEAGQDDGFEDAFEDDDDDDDAFSRNAFADLDGEVEDDDLDEDAQDDDAGLRAEGDDDRDQDHAAEDIPPARRGRDRLSAGAGMTDDEEALSRLMSEADAKMNDPEGRGRREAISHLKAAVAATEAARQLGDKDTGAARSESAFRDDLNEAVRPKRSGPVPSRPIRSDDRPRTERPRPAPLKLVASQRVDVTGDDEQGHAAGADSAGPVRPRRIDRGLGTADKGATATGFVSWARERGAMSLTELVEAAAVHTTVVDEVAAFARPQIMRKVRAATAETANREDELRAFGTLLRQGRFEKVRAGRFRVAADSRFFDNPRAQGQG